MKVLAVTPVVATSEDEAGEVWRDLNVLESEVTSRCSAPELEMLVQFGSVISRKCTKEETVKAHSPFFKEELNACLMPQMELDTLKRFCCSVYHLLKHCTCAEQDLPEDVTMLARMYILMLQDTPPTYDAKALQRCLGQKRQELTLDDVTQKLNRVSHVIQSHVKTMELTSEEMAPRQLKFIQHCILYQIDIDDVLSAVNEAESCLSSFAGITAQLMEKLEGMDQNDEWVYWNRWQHQSPTCLSLFLSPLFHGLGEQRQRLASHVEQLVYTVEHPVSSYHLFSVLSRFWSGPHLWNVGFYVMQRIERGRYAIDPMYRSDTEHCINTLSHEESYSLFGQCIDCKRDYCYSCLVQTHQAHQVDKQYVRKGVCSRDMPQHSLSLSVRDGMNHLVQTLSASTLTETNLSFIRNALIIELERSEHHDSDYVFAMLYLLNQASAPLDDILLLHFVSCWRRFSSRIASTMISMVVRRLCAEHDLQRLFAIGSVLFEPISTTMQRSIIAQVHPTIHAVVVSKPPSERLSRFFDSFFDDIVNTLEDMEEYAEFVFDTGPCIYHCFRERNEAIVYVATHDKCQHVQKQLEYHGYMATVTTIDSDPLAMWNHQKDTARYEWTLFTQRHILQHFKAELLDHVSNTYSFSTLLSIAKKQGESKLCALYVLSLSPSDSALVDSEQESQLNDSIACVMKLLRSNKKLLREYNKTVRSLLSNGSGKSVLMQYIAQCCRKSLRSLENPRLKETKELLEALAERQSQGYLWKIKSKRIEKHIKSPKAKQGRWVMPIDPKTVPMDCFEAAVQYTTSMEHLDVNTDSLLDRLRHMDLSRHNEMEFVLQARLQSPNTLEKRYWLSHMQCPAPLASVGYLKYRFVYVDDTVRSRSRFRTNVLLFSTSMWTPHLASHCGTVGYVLDIDTVKRHALVQFRETCARQQTQYWIPISCLFIVNIHDSGQRAVSPKARTVDAAAVATAVENPYITTLRIKSNETRNVYTFAANNALDSVTLFLGKSASKRRMHLEVYALDKEGRAEHRITLEQVPSERAFYTTIDSSRIRLLVRCKKAHKRKRTLKIAIMSHPPFRPNCIHARPDTLDALCRLCMNPFTPDPVFHNAVSALTHHVAVHCATDADLDRLYQHSREQVAMSKMVSECRHVFLYSYLTVLLRQHNAVSDLAPLIRLLACTLHCTDTTDLTSLEPMLRHASRLIPWNSPSMVQLISVFKPLSQTAITTLYASCRIWYSTRCRPSLKVSINRFKATEAKQWKDTLMGQMYNQLAHVEPCHLRCLPLTQEKEPMCFLVKLLGEFVVGDVGPYRVLFTSLCKEMQSSPSSVLEPTPNHAHEIGEERECFFPKRGLDRKRYFFFGQILGMAVFSNLLLDLYLPTCFWKLLAGESVDSSDIKHVDFHYIHQIGDHGTELEEKACQEWTASYSRLMQEIRSGISAVLSSEFLSLCCQASLESIVCGSSVIPLDLLRDRTVYRGCEATDDHIAYFWRCCSSMPNAMLQHLIEFIFGQRRLPQSSTALDQKQITLSIKSVPSSNPDTELPRADTCFSTLNLPHYSSYAITAARFEQILSFDWGLGGDGDMDVLSPLLARVRYTAL